MQLFSQNYRENRQGTQHTKTKRSHREHFAGSFNSSMAKEDQDDLWNNLDVSHIWLSKVRNKTTSQQTTKATVRELMRSVLPNCTSSWEARCRTGPPSTPSARPLLLSKGNPACLTCSATFHDHLVVVFCDVHLYQLVYSWCCGANFDW